MTSLIVIIIVVGICALRIYLRRSKGKFGEKRVACILNSLPDNRYLEINNLLIRASAGKTTQIDHVVISEYGVFVIETKFYKGLIYGGENSEYWTQNIYGNKYKFLNPVNQNQAHIRALRVLLKDYGDIPFISIVAFSRQADLGVETNAIVVYWDQILPIIKRYEDRCISHIQLVEIYNKLLESNIDSKESRREHIQNVHLNEQKRNMAVASGKCPKCGGDLIVRKGKYGSFYGCSNYPRCKYMLK